jgi:hypothetical protein
MLNAYFGNISNSTDVSINVAAHNAFLHRAPRGAVKPPPREIRVVIGAQVPAPTELSSLPHAAADKVPTARPYEYTIVNDTLVLVDPVSRKIVAIERQ